MMKLSDFQALFRASPYPYLVMAPDLTIIGASGAYLRSVRRTEEDIVGRYVFEAFPADPDHPEATNLEEVRASLLRAMAKGEPDAPPFLRYAVPIETPAGRVFEERYWSTVHTPVMGDDGTPLFTAATSASALVFFVLAMQCLPTLTVTRRETGAGKYALIQLAYMSALAYVSALLVFQLLRAGGIQ